MAGFTTNNRHLAAPQELSLEDVIEEAQAKTRLGWFVGPVMFELLETDTGLKWKKRPVTPRKWSFHEYTNDPETIRSDFLWAYEKLGYVPGIGVDLERSNLLAIDDDARHACECESHQYLKRLHRENPFNPLFRSGSGGVNILFSRPEWLAARRWTSKGHCKKIDVLAGGFLVIPPSVRPDGARYEWRQDTLSQPSALDERHREWIEQLVGSGDTPSLDDKRTVELPDELPHVDVDGLRVSEETKRLVKEGSPVRTRSEVAYRIACDMKRAGYDKAHAIAVLLDTNNGISEAAYDRHDPLYWATLTVDRAFASVEREREEWRRAQRLKREGVSTPSVQALAGQQPQDNGLQKAEVDHSGPENGHREEGQPVSPAQESEGLDTKGLGKSLGQLLQSKTKSINWTVEGLLPEGSALLVGDPGVGKTYFVTQLAVAVASGEKAFGHFPTRRGRVLHLALENSIQEMLTRYGQFNLAPDIVDPNDPWILLDTTCPPVGHGLEEALEDFIQRWPDTALVIVDTLKMIKPEAKPGNNAYDNDYEALQPLRRIAQRWGITILVVHHTNKSKEYSGSTGLAAAANTVLHLQKTQLKIVKANHLQTGEFPAKFRDCQWTVWPKQVEQAPKAVRKATNDTQETQEVPDALKDDAQAMMAFIDRMCDERGTDEFEKRALQQKVTPTRLRRKETFHAVFGKLLALGWIAPLEGHRGLFRRVPRETRADMATVAS